MLSQANYGALYLLVSPGAFRQTLISRGGPALCELAMAAHESVLYWLQVLALQTRVQFNFLLGNTFDYFCDIVL